ncbi:MAG TPA: DNA primase [Candidatus Paceibacterota bacterium]|nr:DNA primase [Candidatus Paceibacterota bacterium]
MSTSVEKIKERLGIVDVVSSYVELKKAGATWKARCPFHNERTPSFIVSPDRGTFYCFGCHAKGDIFSFVEQIEGLDFKGALKLLAERAGVTLEREDPKARGEHERLFSILEHAKQYFAENLAKTPAAMEYLERRGVKKDTLREWALGYALPEWRGLYDHLRSLQFADAEIENAGLAKRREDAGSGERYYDAFRERVMFPIFDASGRVVGFSGRTLSKDPTTPKYINSPETPLFNKSELLYGLHKAKAAIRKQNYAILVEGQMDLIMCHQAGYANAVAASGTALTASHLERLKKLSPRILMCYDSDDAGQNAAQKNAMLALKLGLEVKIAVLPQGSDPADLLLSDPEGWKKAVANSRHIVDFQLDRLLKSGADSRMKAVALRTSVLPFIAELQSKIEQSHYVAEAAKRMGIREDAIWEDLRALSRKDGEKRPAASIAPRPQVKAGSMPSLGERIMGLLYWKPEMEDFRKRVIEIGGEERFLAMKERMAEDSERLIFETEEYYENLSRNSEAPDAIRKDADELLASYERKSLQEDIEKKQSDLRAAEAGSADAEAILKDIHALATRLEDAKRAAGQGNP